MERRITIAGLGLIGGSLGMTLSRQGWDVSFIDPAVSEDEARGSAAARRKLEGIDQAADSIVVLATPVDVALGLIGGAEFGGATVTSVCSVMKPLADAAAVRQLSFSAGHPFAGKELRGLEAADPDLFEGRLWFLDENAVSEGLRVMIEHTGATLSLVSAEEHDAAMALTSHFPQIVATALAAMVEREGHDLEPFVGSGFQSFLRLAGSRHEVWASVIQANRSNLDMARKELDSILEKILMGESEEEFDKANSLYDLFWEGRR